MKIGIAGPISVELLSDLLDSEAALPSTYAFPLLANYARALWDRGHDVTVFALSRDVERPVVFSGERIRIHVGRYRNAGRARDFFKVERHDLIGAMRASGCDVIHAHWTYEFALAALRSGIPTLVTAHDAPLKVLALHHDAYRLVRYLMSTKVARTAPTMTCVSPYVEQHFRRWFGVRNMTVVPNGVPSEVFARRSLRARNQDRPFTFAAVLTGWSARKNPEALLRAFGQVRSRFGARLLMFGEDYGSQETAERWARAHGLHLGVSFEGRRPYAQLLDSLATNVDVLVHPALEETHGMAICEALAMAIPVIGGSKSGAVPWTLDHGKAGMLVDVTRASSLADGMERLIRDEQLRIQLSKRGLESVTARFHMDRMTDGFERIFERLAG